MTATPGSRTSDRPTTSCAEARRQLLARYRQLVLHDLPAAARAGGWTLTADHCFGRVVLDHAVGGRWCDHLDRRRPAYPQLSDAQLAAAVDLAGGILREGDCLLRELNAQSLHWRRDAGPAATRARAGRGGAPPPASRPSTR